MRKVLIIFVLVATLSVQASATMYAKPLPDGLERMVSVTVRPVDLSKLAGAPVDEWERILYPSGMQLPTKYLDLALTSYVEASVEVSSATYVFLVKNWPCEDKAYTYPEILAAQMWLNVWFMSQFPLEPTSTSQAVTAWLAANELAVTPTTSTMTLTDTGAYWEAIVTAVALGRQSGVENFSTANGATYSMGYAFPWETYFMNASDDEQGIAFVEFWESRLQFMTDLGLTLVETSTSCCNFATMYPESQGHETSSGGAFESAEEPSEPSVDVPPSVGDTEKPNYKPEYVGDDYVNTVPVITTGIGEPDKSIGLRDIYTTICIILAVVFIAVGTVVDYLKKRDDPASKYKRW